jgi:hypothetical protein
VLQLQAETLEYVTRSLGLSCCLPPNHVFVIIYAYILIILYYVIIVTDHVFSKYPTEYNNYVKVKIKSFALRH